MVVLSQTTIKMQGGFIIATLPKDTHPRKLDWLDLSLLLDIPDKFLPQNQFVDELHAY